MVVEILIVLLILVFTLRLYLSTAKSSRLPPGPWSIPILGHLPLLGDQPARTLLKWTEKYGPIISVRFGSYPAVVIHDASLIKEAFNLPAFAGRPHVKLLDDMTRGRKGFMYGDGPNSQEQRQFLRRNLKDFGYGSRTMESIISDQVDQLLESLERNVSNNLAVIHLFNGYTVNSLWTIVSGIQFDPKGDSTAELADAVSRASTLPGILSKLMMFLPGLAIYLPGICGYYEKMQCAYDVQNFLEKQIKQVNKSRIPNQPRVVMDAYLDKIEETTDLQSSFHEKQNNITIAMQDLFCAGVETTSTAMEWTFYYLAKHPSIQIKLQNEIDTIIGSSRLPSAADKLHMPYTEAVTNEILRISTILPFSLFHNSVEDAKFHGYKIPKNTMVLGNLHAVHNDPQVWGDPEIFRPDRFLSKEGQVLKIEEFIPFSSGKRNCIGENLARLQLFLFTASIFQRFEISSAGELPSFEGKFGLTLTPHPFHVLIKNRTVI